ncbi:MAG: stage II sporulation protein R [Christensenellales bacterium]|jgi:stage II sporulation protein R
MKKVAIPLALAVLLILSAVRPMRLHVIANSDTEYDQAVKLAVRDAVLGVLNDDGGPENFEDAEAAIVQNGEALQQAVDNTLKEWSAGYSGTLYLGNSAFPEKVYAGKVYPAGKYEALRVVLGEGGGKNWWCVIYPPLCLGEFAENGEGPVVFRSFLAELFHRWFGI